jgi:hypothetical protein
MSVPPSQAFKTDRGAGAGSLREQKNDKKSDEKEDRTYVGTGGSVLATTADPQTDINSDNQIGDPSLTDVSLESGNTATVANSSGTTGRIKGALTVSNRDDGGTTVSVDRGGEQAATTVKKQGGDGVRVDQLDAVQEQNQSSSPDGGSSGGSGNPDGPIERLPIPSGGGSPLPSGLPIGGGGQQLGGSGLLDKITSPAGLIVTAVVVGAAAYVASDDNGGNGGSNDGQ